MIMPAQIEGGSTVPFTTLRADLLSPFGEVRRHVYKVLT